MPKDAKRPNLLFIMDDQHRHDFLACAGADFLRTPNLDRLAERGVRFTRCGTNSPVCAPARIGLAAGQRPHRLGALDNSAFLPLSQPTYYGRLRDRGYRVGCVGKLDLAKPDPYNGRFGDRPCTYAVGFTHPEECEGKMHAGNFDSPQGPYGFHLQERGLFAKFRADYKARRAAGWALAAHDSVLPTDAFEDAYVGRRAAEWIERVPDDFPWHLFVSFVGPHDPFDPPAEHAERWRDAAMPEAIPDSDEATRGKPGWVRRRRLGADPGTVAVTRRQYAALIELIDDGIGRILDALDRRGMAENTCVVFASDHGEMLGDHGLYQKQVAYEPTLRVPLIVAGPGIAGGRVSDALVELMDVNPTLCELAGLPPQENIDARSLGPVLRGETDAHREAIVSTHRNFQCIRTERHKLVRSYNDAPELYDLAEDPQERVNLAPESPDLVGKLSKDLRSRLLEGGPLR